MLGAPDIREDLALAYLGTATVVLVFPLLLAVLVEAPLLVLSDRASRRHVIAASLAVQAVVTAIAAATGRPAILGAALAVWGVGAGLSTAVARGALVVAFPHDRERVMTRWAFWGAAGDLVAPLLMAASPIFGGWRGALVVISALYAVHAGVMWRRPLSDARDETPDDAPPAAPGAMRSSRLGLALWLLATALCCCLDEILVAFGSMFLRDDVGAGPALRSAAFAAFAVGWMVGLAASERWLTRIPARRILMWSAAGCVLGYLGWLSVRTPVASVVLLVWVGLTAAPLHPIAQAQAFAAWPSRPGAVQALELAFMPLELAVPLVVGGLADGCGLPLAMLVLVVQPVGVLVIGGVTWRRRGDGRRGAQGE